MASVIKHIKRLWYGSMPPITDGYEIKVLYPDELVLYKDGKYILHFLFDSNLIEGAIGIDITNEFTLKNIPESDRTIIQQRLENYFSNYRILFR